MSRMLDASNYNTDKSIEYLANYEKYFKPFLNKDVRLLELGVRYGGSLFL
ncbi:MAG: hypothetical protein KAI59_05155 [Planctomycetes bacterium]|nr:hypothetical protein [Planctomycetota bacterium]MCK5473399.1 hypothetical protein [Planctomycetota bacterium]